MRPNLISAYRLAEGRFNDCHALMPDGYYRIARPISAPTLSQRFIWAWRVFTGKYDALVWPGQGDE